MVNIHIKKEICHSYKDYAQTSVCVFIIAMETSINKVKMPHVFYIFLLFLKLLIRDGVMLMCNGN